MFVCALCGYEVALVMRVRRTSFFFFFFQSHFRVLSMVLQRFFCLDRLAGTDCARAARTPLTREGRSHQADQKRTLLLVK